MKIKKILRIALKNIKKIVIKNLKIIYNIKFNFKTK